MLKAAVR